MKLNRGGEPKMQTKLRAWRRFYDISQEDMAKQLGIDVRTYINKEHGVTQFKANEMFKIAQILQKDIGDIFLPPPFMEHEDMIGGVSS
jgi:DNA-binding XRE family transcriptional regulator